MTSVDSNFNFLCGRPHGAWPPPTVHMRPSVPSSWSWPPPLRVDVINGWPPTSAKLPLALSKFLCYGIGLFTRAHIWVFRLQPLHIAVKLSDRPRHSEHVDLAWLSWICCLLKVKNRFCLPPVARVNAVGSWALHNKLPCHCYIDSRVRMTWKQKQTAKWTLAASSVSEWLVTLKLFESCHL